MSYFAFMYVRVCYLSQKQLKIYNTNTRRLTFIEFCKYILSDVYELARYKDTKIDFKHI